MTIRDRVKALELSARRRLGLDDHAKVFDTIYREDSWRGGSGPGSTPDNTGPYRDFIATFLRDRQIRSVLDIGCGDWQFSRLIDWSGVSYLGTDVSETALKLARQHERPGVSFQLLNAVASPLPPADLLIAKDVLQHWSNQDILDFFPKLTGFKYALITNGFPAHKERYLNRDIRPGKGRPVELAAAPFNLPGEYIFEYPADEPKQVFLWQRP